MGKEREGKAVQIPPVNAVWTLRRNRATPFQVRIATWAQVLRIAWAGYRSEVPVFDFQNEGERYWKENRKGEADKSKRNTGRACLVDTGWLLGHVRAGCL